MSGPAPADAGILRRFRLDNRTALVTGGNRGIGFAACRAFAEAGARVLVAGRNDHAIEEAAASLRADGHNAAPVRLDVSDPAAIERVARATNAGPDRVDILFANAGIGLPDRPAEDMPDADWDRMVGLNLSAAFRCCREFGRFMLERGSGSIVANGSMSGLVSNVPQRQAAYNAAKAGLHHLVRSLAGEWASRGVRVNAVAPGYVATDLSAAGLADPATAEQWLSRTPMRRAGTPEEIAAVTLFLASDAASFLTGSVVVADGGYCVW